MKRRSDEIMNLKQVGRQRVSLRAARIGAFVLPEALITRIANARNLLGLQVEVSNISSYT